MSSMVCTVSFQDEHGATHAVTLSASSLYEAVGLAVQAFKRQPSVPPVSPLATLTIAVRAPTVQHRVTLDKARRWASRTATSPADKLQRERVRSLLALR
jgi:hypothetical protein